MQDILKGNMSYEEATVQITSYTERLRAQALAVGGKNQQLVQPIMEVFENLGKVSLEMKKPGVQKENLQAQYDTLMLQAKLAFIVNPKTRASVAASNLIPQSADMATQASVAVIERLSAVEAMDLSVPIYSVPGIIGNAETEKPSLDLIRGSLEKLHKGTAVGDQAKVERSATNAVNNLLRQTEDIVNRGATADKLTNIASFYASPEFGKLAASGKLDAQTMQGAMRAFQSYNQAVVGGVEAELASASGSPTRGTPAPRIYEVVDLSFSGGRVTFTPIGNTEKTRDSVAKMKKSEDALTRLVIIGAHMEGTQDYAKYWEKSKHLILPSVYADPERFPAGFVNPSNGWKFKGGVFANPANWEKPKDGSK